MAKDQLKGAAGIEFISEDISGYDTNDDTTLLDGPLGVHPTNPTLKEVSSLVSYPLISSVMNSIPAAPFS
jgi:hypothetical protein